MRKVSKSEMDRQQTYLEQVSVCQADHRSSTGFARRYYIQTYGCQLNENDSERISGLLDMMGYIAAGQIREADLIIFNTCSVRENADDRLFGNLGMVKNMSRDNPDLIVAVCGCMMKQDEHVDRIKQSFSFVDLVFGPQDIYRLPELLYTQITEKRRIYDVTTEDTLVEGLPIHRARKFRALCSIMFGCNNFCTYCIVPYTRGRERSRKPGDILDELRGLAPAGYREVMLLGQNVNSYGNDLTSAEQPRDFADLLAAVATQTGLQRIRFMTSHPKDISDKLLETMAKHDEIEKHLHLPLQSGSNRILKRMNRHYTREQYLQIVEKARQLMPQISITTDLIVGFPGETEQDFTDTLDIMEKVQFDAAFTFQYSKRSGTPAAEMDDQIPPDTVRERFGRLVDLQNRHSLESNEQLVGTTEDILIEGTSQTADDIMTGRTLSNKLINFRIYDEQLLPDQFKRADGQPDGEKLEGCFAKVKLVKAKTFSIEGEMESLVT